MVEIKYLISLLIRSVVEAKCGVELHHATYNAARNQLNVGNRSVLMKTERVNARFPTHPAVNLIKKILYTLIMKSLKQ